MVNPNVVEGARQKAERRGRIKKSLALWQCGRLQRERVIAKGIVNLECEAEPPRSRCRQDPGRAPGVRDKPRLSRASLGCLRSQARARSNSHVGDARVWRSQIARAARHFAGSTTARGATGSPFPNSDRRHARLCSTPRCSRNSRSECPPGGPRPSESPTPMTDAATKRRHISR